VCFCLERATAVVMEWDLPGSFTEGGADIMEMCSSLPALDGSEDLAGMLPTLHGEWSSPRLAKQEKVLESLPAHPPAPEPEPMRACPASPETSAPSSPEREEDDAGSTWEAPTQVRSALASSLALVRAGSLS
jgi:hypothetical protein